jgi:hypothetical protein
MGKFSLNFDSVDLNQLVTDISSMIRIQVQLRPSVTFELNIQSNGNMNENYSDGGNRRRSPSFGKKELFKEFVTDAQRLK